MKNYILGKGIQKTVASMLCLIYMLVCPMTVWATNLTDSIEPVHLENTKLFTGTVGLIKGGTLALIGITVIVTAVLLVLKGFKWQTAEQQEKPGIRKSMLETLFVMGIILTIESIVALVANVFL